MKYLATLSLFLCGSIAHAQPTTLTESFDSFYGPTNNGWGPRAGWYEQNNSNPAASSAAFFNGSPAQFSAQSGQGYAASNRGSVSVTEGEGTISTWLLTPPMSIANGTSLAFWTRSDGMGLFPDRLQVRLSLNFDSVDVGTSATDTGDFDRILLDINPNYTATGYPLDWTQEQVFVAGIQPGVGRFAFRHFAEHVKPDGVFYPAGQGGNGFYVGIDSMTITQTPEPSSLVLAGVAVVAAWRRKPW